MFTSQFEKILLLYLDPVGKHLSEKWVFCKRVVISSFFPRRIEKFNSIYTFDRKQLIEYLICSCLFFLIIPKERLKKVYYLQDNLMSMFFLPSSSKGYYRFAKNHLSKHSSFREKLKYFMPLFLKADRRFIIVRQKNFEDLQSDFDFLIDFEFMFFSNPIGKIIIVSVKTLIDGFGLIGKTTCNNNYIKTLFHEASVISTINSNLKMKDRIPRVLKDFYVGERGFVIEDYIEGQTLREILRDPSVCTDISLVKIYMNRLDEWFVTYRSTFKGKPVLISKFYKYLFEKFNEAYGDDSSLLILSSQIQKELDEISQRHNGLTPGISHNDLWPGNILDTPKGLVVIDWERAVIDQCELFDYFWMMISTAMEILIGKEAADNYFSSFLIFLQGEDPACINASMLLRGYAKKLGFLDAEFKLLMKTFLLEWAIQGYLVFGVHTEMDDIALKGFKYYCSLDKD